MVESPWGPLSLLYLDAQVTFKTWKTFTLVFWLQIHVMNVIFGADLGYIKNLDVIFFIWLSQSEDICFS